QRAHVAFFRRCHFPESVERFRLRAEGLRASQREGDARHPAFQSASILLQGQGKIMRASNRRLTTVAAAGALAALAAGAVSQLSQAQTAVPSGEVHRFTPSTLRVDPESSATEAPAVGTLSVPGEGSPSGFFREAPAAFDNRTNGFDPQGPDFGTIDEDTVVPLRSFNDNRFIFEEVEGVADGLGPTFNAQAC